MIRALLFDMGNVLVHFSHDRMCEQMAAVCGTDVVAMRRALFEEGLLCEFECGRLTERQMHRQLEDRFVRPLSFDELVRAGSDIFSLNGSIVPVLDRLKVQGYRLVLVSNTSISHLNWVRQEWDVLDRFDRLVTSYEAGAVKPGAAIFQAALEAAECTPGECFYTDDVAAYVEAGRSFGIDAEVFTGTGALIAHLRRRGVGLDDVA